MLGEEFVQQILQRLIQFLHPFVIVRLRLSLALRFVACIRRVGEQLCQMKDVLARPGRGGQWSSFLMERGIPRATADRLVARHQRSLDPDANRLSEPVSEPTEEEVQKLFTSVWPKLRRTLRSRESLHLFINLLTSHFECGETDREKLMLTPTPPTICTLSSEADSIVEPEGAALPPGGDHEVICVL